MKRIVLIFSDKFTTTFMQSGDVFEPFKVLMKPPVMATVADGWGEKEIAAIKTLDGNYLLIAAVGEEILYADPKVRVVSNGKGWVMFDEFLAEVKEKESGRKWETNFTTEIRG